MWSASAVVEPFQLLGEDGAPCYFPLSGKSGAADTQVFALGGGDEALGHRVLSRAVAVLSVCTVNAAIGIICTRSPADGACVSIAPSLQGVEHKLSVRATYTLARTLPSKQVEYAASEIWLRYWQHIVNFISPRCEVYNPFRGSSLASHPPYRAFATHLPRDASVFRTGRERI
jgi:hypothetical protein